MNPLKRIRDIPCLICKTLPVQLAHVISRGAGGGDDMIVPLCPVHHNEQHTTGIESFQTKYDINLLEEARRIQRALSEVSPE